MNRKRDEKAESRIKELEAERDHLMDSRENFDKARRKAESLNLSLAIELKECREALEAALNHDCYPHKCNGHMEDVVKPPIRRALKSRPSSLARIEAMQRVIAAGLELYREGKFVGAETYFTELSDALSALDSLDQSEAK